MNTYTIHNLTSCCAYTDWKGRSHAGVIRQFVKDEASELMGLSVLEVIDDKTKEKRKFNVTLVPKIERVTE